MAHVSAMLLREMVHDLYVACQRKYGSVDSLSLLIEIHKGIVTDAAISILFVFVVRAGALSRFQRERLLLGLSLFNILECP